MSKVKSREFIRWLFKGLFQPRKLSRSQLSEQRTMKNFGSNLKMRFNMSKKLQLIKRFQYRNQMFQNLNNRKTVSYLLTATFQLLCFHTSFKVNTKRRFKTSLRKLMSRLLTLKTLSLRESGTTLIDASRSFSVKKSCKPLSILRWKAKFRKIA